MIQSLGNMTAFPYCHINCAVPTLKSFQLTTPVVCALLPNNSVLQPANQPLQWWQQEYFSCSKQCLQMLRKQQDWTVTLCHLGASTSLPPSAVSTLAPRPGHLSELFGSQDGKKKKNRTKITRRKNGIQLIAGKLWVGLRVGRMKS